MAETRKKAEGEYLMYQGKPLVREENTLIYRDGYAFLYGRIVWGLRLVGAWE